MHYVICGNDFFVLVGKRGGGRGQLWGSGGGTVVLTGALMHGTAF